MKPPPSTTAGGDAGCSSGGEDLDNGCGCGVAWGAPRKGPLGTTDVPLPSSADGDNDREGDGGSPSLTFPVNRLNDVRASCFFVSPNHGVDELASGEEPIPAPLPALSIDLFRKCECCGADNVLRRCCCWESSSVPRPRGSSKVFDLRCSPLRANVGGRSLIFLPTSEPPDTDVPSDELANPVFDSSESDIDGNKGKDAEFEEGYDCEFEGL